MSHISKTAASILADALSIGHAVVLTHKAREMDAAKELIAQGIVHIHAGNDRLWRLHPGRRPFGFETKVIA